MEFKEIIMNARRKLETPMAPAMPCKTCKTNKHGETRNKTNDSGVNLRVSWMPVNPQECVLKNLYRNIMRTILHEKGTIHCNITIGYTIFPVPEAMKIPAAKAAVDKEWEKLEKIPARDITKVKNKSEVIDEARTKGIKVHFASLMDICHLENPNWRQSTKKCKGRIVLRGDIVKDDSGSSAVFTEQGSSASQMTAAKVMDIVSRLPGCAGQAADAVSAFSQWKWKVHHHCLNFRSQNVQISGHVHQSTDGPNQGPAWKI